MQFLIKLCLLVASVILQLKAVLPPNITTESDNVKAGKSFYERNISFLVYFWILPIYIVPIFAQMFIVLVDDLSSSEWGKTLFLTTCPSGVSASFQRLTPTFFIGCACMLTSALIRLWCYRTLGRFFTYKVSIRPGHQVIDSGPYRFVRHPSYMGLFLRWLGAVILMFDPQGLPAACGWTTSMFYQQFQIVWIGSVIYFVASTWLRMPMEEENLARHLGKEWQAYTQKVRYRLIPGVY